MSEFLIDSLRRRIRTLNILWERAVGDITLEQINHHERPSVLPIALSLSHAIRVQDRTICRSILGEQPIWDRDRWAERVGVTVDKIGTGERVEDMEILRIGYLEAWKAYQVEVIAATNRVVETVDEATLCEVVFPEVTRQMQGFTAMMVGVGNPIRKLDLLEGIIFQHGLRHLGEIEHARALVGLGGLAG